MGQHATIYGLDIETDTSVNAIDPTVSSVRAVALSGAGFEELFLGPETKVIVALDRRLAELPAGVLATWNGGIFDLPFLADRARHLGLRTGLLLQADPGCSQGRVPLPGHRSAYRGSWHHHGHVDSYHLYGSPSGQRGRHPVRSLSRMLGLGGDQRLTEQARLEELTNEALHAHAASDARLARIMVERRWAAAVRNIERVELAPRAEARPDRAPARTGQPAIASA